MGQFSLAAILAALCSSLCLYGSSSSGGDLKYAARIMLEVALGLGNVFTVLLIACDGGERPGNSRFMPTFDRMAPVARYRRCDSGFGKCDKYHQVKTSYKGAVLVSLLEEHAHVNSPPICAPLSRLCLCDSGTCCCDAQQGHYTKLGNLLRLHPGGYTMRGNTTPILFSTPELFCNRVTTIHGKA